MALTKTQVSELYVAIFNRASEGTGNTYWQGEGSAAEVAQKMLDTVDAKEYFGTAIDDDKAFIEHIYINTLGKTYAEDAEGIDFWVARLANGESRGEVVAALVVAATDPQYAGTAAQKQFLNRVEVSNYAADTVKDEPANYKQSLGFDGDLTVTDDAATVGAAKGNVDKLAGDKPGVDGKSFQLTQKADIITGTDGDDVFVAPVTQNETGDGRLANTFETGDVLDGGAGHNILRADLIDSGSISDGSFAPAISATTSNIQEVYLRAQSPQNDGSVNLSTVDAEKMAGVQQWWSDNSRSNIQIEDIRTDSAATTFGMRLTDPGVSLNAYFNALFLEGDKSATSAMTLNIYEGPLGAPNAATQLANISVREVAFKLDGKQVTLDTAAIRAADTWNELETALNAALAETEGADSLTLVNRGNGQFVIEDTKGRVFEVKDGEALVLSVTNNITVTNSLTVGREEVAGPVISNAILDGAGNGSQGGTLNIGAMSGLRGVEQLELDVDRDSHLQSITSFNRIPGQYANLRNGEPNEFLEVVNLNSIGAEGDLTVGRSTANLDGRVATWSSAAGVVTGIANSGFVNILELNGADFNGALNVAVTLDDNAIGRYLDKASETVTFSYVGGAHDDIFNIADVSTVGSVSSDQDFAMNVDLGAGDDRLILNVPTVRAVSVDGGEGTNSIVVANSHGTNAANTFAGFANFQTYEVEGNVAATQHDFTSMSGVENVIIATNGGVNTQLINLEAAQDVTVSGKNQTIGNNSTNNQLFGTVTLTNDAGVDRTVTLDNTARLSNAADGVATPKDGILSVANLVIDQQVIGGVAGSSATRNLTIESGGARNVANVIAQLDAARVNTLTLEGTQDLTINVNSIANTPATAQAPLSITGADLTGDLNLALNGTQLNLITGTGTDTIVGTAGDSDTFMVYGALNAGNNASVTGFETVQIGSAAGTLFGDTVINQASSGTLNTASIVADQYVVANLDGTLQLNGLGSGKTIDLGDANTDVNGDTTTVNNQTLNQQINIVSSAANAAGTLAEVSINRLDVIASGTATNIDIGDSVASVGAGIGGYRTINLDVARDSNLAATASDVNYINLAVGSTARTLNITGGQDGRSNVNAVALETQIIDFAGSGVVTAAGNLTIGSYTFNLGITAGTLDDEQVAADIAAAITGQDVFGTGNNVTATANGTEVRIEANVLDSGVNVNEVAVSVPAGSTLVTATPIRSDVTSVDPTTATTVLADTLDFTDNGAFTDDLLLALETIDLSDYSGQVTLRMEQGVAAADQTDVNFVMNGYDATITLSNGTGVAVDATDVTHNSVFVFTEAGSVANPTTWTVSNIVAGGLANANVNNTTLFDLTDLGITNFAQVEVSDSGFSLDGTTALSATTVAIRSEAEANVNGETWEIIVTGVEAIGGAGGITADNFIFV